MSLLVLLGAIFVGWLIYFSPAIIAFQRRHRNYLAITVLNLFLGWTFVGWVVALVWVFTANTATRTGRAA